MRDGTYFVAYFAVASRVAGQTNKPETCGKRERDEKPPRTAKTAAKALLRQKGDRIPAEPADAAYCPVITQPILRFLGVVSGEDHRDVFFVVLCGAGSVHTAFRKIPGCCRPPECWAEWSHWNVGSSGFILLTKKGAATGLGWAQWLPFRRRRNLNNPVLAKLFQFFPHAINSLIRINDLQPLERFPCVFTTYRLTEHHTSGAMSRMLPHLAELQPEFFAEISPELAAERGIENGGWMTIIGMRGVIEARALVTPRMQPLIVEGKKVHQVGLPYHWGYRGLVKGDAANDLLSISEEPNVRIMESKRLLGNLFAGRRGQGKQALEQMEAHIRGESWQ
jgi:Molydopterin dinucleotide binding domain